MPKITIDGKSLEAPADASVLDVALENGIWIPTLCHHESLSEYGACRLCLVEVVRRGRGRVTASCTLPVQDGQEIVTQSDRVTRLRRLVMELILASCPHSNAVLEIAGKLGVKSDRLEADKTSDCIRCGLCVRACDEISGAHAINFANRGMKRTITTPFHSPSAECVLCGACVFVCPTGSRLLDLAKISGEKPRELLSRFDAQLQRRGAINRPFPQALPNVPVIDCAACLHLNRDACGICEKVCEAGAIRFDDVDKEEEIDVGAAIVVPGFDEFRPEQDYETGYSRFPDVVTSMEFERILSASGPFSGHVVRPSDHQEPRRIAFLQCVGSRDIPCRSGYCSSVCCMYAVKEAFIAREHLKNVETTVFFMDLRAFGKDFDKYCDRAEKEQGVRFVRARVFDVAAGGSAGSQLLLKYALEDGGVAQDAFDMVVLSIGLKPTDETRQLARNLGLRLNEHGFVWTEARSPLWTSRSGVFAAGVASGPKDIPETVVQASAAACEAGRLLADARGTLTQKPVFPPERDVTGQAPRVGVFVCHCGINIGGVVNVPSVAEYAKGLPGVVYAEDNLYTCSQDTQDHIRDLILKHNLNRIVVASCSPRTHEPLFQQTLREAGLNPYLFEMANIRDQCSWIHMNQPAEATTKARDLVRMAVAKVALTEPLQAAKLDVTHSALVIGGGLAGMMSALAIADQGFDVTLIERDKELGGNLRRLRRAFDEPDIPSYLEQITRGVRQHSRIRVLTRTTLEHVEGFVGNFESTVNTGGKKKKVEHGAVIVATGGAESRPTEYAYGQSQRVLTQMELEARLSKRNGLAQVKSVVMIQCVGSRESGHMYCSRVCCNTAIKNAIRIRELSPSTEVTILYRDVRSYGFYEKHYQDARDKGVVFVRFPPDRKPVVERGSRLVVTVREPLVNQDLVLHPNLLVLSSRIDPDAQNEALSHLLKVPMNEDKFFLEAHVKLRPVEFATEGVFVAGLAHSPKSIPETLAQAQAAAAKAVAILSRDTFDAEPTIAALNDELCDGCGICVPVCEYNALEVIARPGGKPDEKIVRLNEAMCKGCGGCVAACPSGAMEQKGFKNTQILAMIRAALKD